MHRFVLHQSGSGEAISAPILGKACKGHSRSITHTATKRMLGECFRMLLSGGRPVLGHHAHTEIDADEEDLQTRSERQIKDQFRKKKKQNEIGLQDYRYP
jgi:hypothetical protein